jgi:CRP-like cAMP-binding protein
MLGRHWVRPYPKPRSSSRDRVCSPHAPWQNHVLSALPRADFERLLPDLEPVSLRPGCTLHRAGEQEKYLYFLTAGIVSRFGVTEDGASAEYAVTGSEGVIGVAAFLGADSTPYQAMVLSAGYAYRLKAVKDEFERDGPLPHLVLRYIQALIVQTGQIAVCNRHHSLEQRLCRWILSCLDRLSSNELTMTQELIAHMLGVRRESVTEAAGNLKSAGLIHYGHGKIIVLNRRELEKRACECYAVVHDLHAKLSSGCGFS